MGLKITISFKETEEDIYNWVKEHSYYSAFMKDLIKKEIKKESVKGTDKEEKFNLIDF